MSDKHSIASIKPKGVSWASLPAEIRLIILEAITLQKSRGWASLASVCKEWQLVIEKKNFHRLKLQVSCLDGLQSMVIRQRELVHHIQLDIELRRYTCRCCEWPESGSWTSSNNSTIRYGIWKLFSILSTWNPANALALELNAYSPSDSEHWFKDFCFVSNSESDGEAGRTSAMWHDPKHGWINGQRVKNPSESAIIRLFETVFISFREELPQVDVITCFIIRRQLRRYLHFHVLQLIWGKLPRLEHIIYEPWRAWESWDGKAMDKEFRLLVQDHLPNALKKLSIFEDFNEDLANILANSQFPGALQYNTSRLIDPRLGEAFAFRSLGLEELSVSYMIDAKDFFQACMPTWTWQHLQSLALTSQLLQQSTSRQEIHDLLSSAGIALLQMPRLHTFVLWNGTRGNACAFIYHTNRHSAHLTWRSTWDLELSPCVVKLWQSVASKMCFLGLSIDKQEIQGTVVSHGDAIHNLNLPCQVVVPASLWQIRKEGGQRTT